MRAYPRSKTLHERACRALAGGVSSEFRKGGQPHPLFYARFVLGMQEHGIRLIGRGLWYVSSAHTDADLALCARSAQEVFKTL